MVLIDTTLAPVHFRRESAGQVIEEISLLWHLHWNEVGHYRDMPIDPDLQKYAQFEANGSLRIYAARQASTLMGYAIYLLSTGLHYRDVIMAQESTTYLHPSVRATTCNGIPAGKALMSFAERALVLEGVQVISRHVKARHDLKRARAFVRLLERDGYELQDYVLTKKLS